MLNKLFTYTQLQDTVSVNMLALVGGEPKTLSLKQVLEEYLKFQVEVITNRSKFDLERQRSVPISSRASCWQSTISTKSLPFCGTARPFRKVRLA